MDSVDKMREFVDDQFSVRGQAYKQGMAIADEIEAEIAEAEAFCRRVEEAARNNDELDVFGVAYMPIPTDADGVPIRAGDKLEHASGGWTFTADSLEIDRWGAHVRPNGQARVQCANCRHAKPRTLEDVLAEFGRESVGASMQQTNALLAKYAAEIRELLGGDAE